VRLPRAYLVGTPTTALADLLAEHGLASRTLEHAVVDAEPLSLAAGQLPVVPQDTLEIPVMQRHGVLAALLFEPVSGSRLFGRSATASSLSDLGETAVWRLR
jgi:hypothetical protein